MVIKRDGDYYMRVTKGIILAAGDGDRLGILTEQCPKALLPVGGLPLIGYPIVSLVSAGIKEIAIVIGHLEDQIREALGDGSLFGASLSYISNGDYLGGNGVSVHKAREWARGLPVILCMGDHLIEGDLISRLVENGDTDETLCVDHSPRGYLDINEATKVALDGNGCITGIGKGLTDWDALDTGVFLLTSRFFQVLNKLVRSQGFDLEMSDVIRSIIARGGCFATCDVSGCFWVDVDTEHDLNIVRRATGDL